MDPTYLYQMLAASLCGFLFGLEREKSNKDAGARTNMLVCIAACLLTIVSKEGFLMPDADASRVAASVIPGIGFLGAGSIFQKGNRVSGLTTASVVLITASVGMAIGAGLYEVAGCVTVFVCVIMYGSRLIESHKRAKMREKTWDEVEKGI
ncbi:MAG: MgtC/SapB family protein [Oscillospiraceae bacterium]|nr:MgtC/SapB family protein [Oscillospiraceae bacterium]